MKKMTFFILTGFILWAVPVHADMKQIKEAYMVAFPNADKPKCINCHVDKMPKKEDGAHDNNDYGKAAVAAAKKAGLTDGKPTADTYKALGPIPNAS